jgi:FkbM family methyltransferase
VLYKIPSSRVIVFEPSPQNFACLKENIVRNGFADRCTALEKAVSKDSEPKTLFISSSTVNPSLITKNKVVGESQVACTTLEQIFADFNIKTCDLLKIDCEGSEYDILMNTPKAIFERIPHIRLEWHTVPNVSIDDLAKFLTGMGYAVEWSAKPTMADEGFLTAHRTK